MGVGVVKRLAPCISDNLAHDRIIHAALRFSAYSSSSLFGCFYTFFGCTGFLVYSFIFSRLGTHYSSLNPFFRSMRSLFSNLSSCFCCSYTLFENS